MAGKIPIVALMMVCVVGVQSHTYYLGSCPRVEPVNDFDMSKVQFQTFYDNKNIQEE
jgi:hypothetical protein